LNIDTFIFESLELMTISSAERQVQFIFNLVIRQYHDVIALFKVQKVDEKISATNLVQKI